MAMTWPWVSRLAFDMAVTAMHQSERTAEALRRENADLITKLTEQHHAEPARLILPTATPDIPREPSAIAQAIREESGGDLRLAHYFRKRARELRNQGASEADIVAAIQNWQTTEPVIESA